MNFTIQEVASKFNLSAHTIRFYDKEGLLPFITRSSSGNRVFTERDLDWLALICCLKDTGMPIKEIKQYSDWCRKGSETIPVRKELLSEHRQEVTRQIDELKKNLELIDAKIAFYDNSDNIQLLNKLRDKPAAAANDHLSGS
jgi:DNA-binding transcriptional MerR regulator